MMAYVKIVDGVVVQRQPYDEESFVAVPDDIVCGMIYADGEFSVPEEHTGTPAYRLYKSTLIRRLSDAEAITLSNLLAAAPLKNQMIWAASDFLLSDDPLFSEMSAAIAQALGAERSSQILAPE